jgi:hypothetical protein
LIFSASSANPLRSLWLKAFDFSRERKKLLTAETAENGAEIAEKF